MLISNLYKSGYSVSKLEVLDLHNRTDNNDLGVRRKKLEYNYILLSKTKDTASLIKVAIIAYFLIALFAVQLDKQWEFWILAVAVGCFQGGIQALSRSYFAKIIPENASGEYFGLFDICGKGASFLGTMLIGVVTQITGKQNLGVAALSIMFVIGYLIFNKVSKMDD